MNKDQLYNLIGRPHSLKVYNGVEEWDYVQLSENVVLAKFVNIKILVDKTTTAPKLLLVSKRL